MKFFVKYCTKKRYLCNFRVAAIGMFPRFLFFLSQKNRGATPSQRPSSQINEFIKRKFFGATLPSNRESHCQIGDYNLSVAISSSPL